MSNPIQDAAISRTESVDNVTIARNSVGQLELKGGAVSFGLLGSDVARSIAEAHIGVCLAAASSYSPTNVVPDYFSTATGANDTVDTTLTNASYASPGYETGSGVPGFASSTDSQRNYMGQDSDRYGRIGQAFTLATAGTITGATVRTGTFGGSPSKKVIITIETDDSGYASGTLAHANASWTSPSNIQPSTAYNASFTSFTLPAGTYHLVIGMEDGLTSGGYAYIQTKSGSSTSCFLEENKSGQPRYNHYLQTGYALYASVTVTYSDSVVVSKALTPLDGASSDVGLFGYNANAGVTSWDLAPNGSTWTHTGLTVNEWAGLPGVTLSNARVRLHLTGAGSIQGWAVMLK